MKSGRSVGVKIGTKWKRRLWSPADVAILRDLYPNTPTTDIAKVFGRPVSQVHAKAGKLKLKKSEEYLNSAAACRLTGQNPRSIACRFVKGQVPANKGLRRPGYSVGRGRMQETAFKKGGRSFNSLPIGTVRTDYCGYLRKKIGDGIGGTGNQKVWAFVHKLVWEEAHGPVPKGHRIWWKDRNHQNCTLENLELLTNAEHMARTTIHTLPPELKEVIHIRAGLVRRIRNREKRNGKKQDLRSA